MKVINILISVGDQAVENTILINTEGYLNIYDIYYTAELEDADMVICTVEQAPRFPRMPLLLLTDSKDTLETFETALEYSPFPVVDDDYRRLEWRIQSLVDLL